MGHKQVRLPVGWKGRPRTETPRYAGNMGGRSRPLCSHRLRRKEEKHLTLNPSSLRHRQSRLSPWGRPDPLASKEGGSWGGMAPLPRGAGSLTSHPPTPLWVRSRRQRWELKNPRTLKRYTAGLKVATTGLLCCPTNVKIEETAPRKSPWQGGCPPEAPRT